MKNIIFLLLLTPKNLTSNWYNVKPCQYSSKKYAQISYGDDMREREQMRNRREKREKERPKILEGK